MAGRGFVVELGATLTLQSLTIRGAVASAGSDGGAAVLVISGDLEAVGMPPVCFVWWKAHGPR